jgi:protein translocase SecG subunit
MFNEITILASAVIAFLAGIIGLSWYYGIFIAAFIITSLILLLLILIQKGKSSMGIGNLGGGNQMLFGGSGGQDIFQKITWVLGAIFMGGSLLLALVKKPSHSDLIRRLERNQTTVQMPVRPAEQMPAESNPEE